jgi:Domain of unknown function (DUF4398)
MSVLEDHEMPYAACKACTDQSDLQRIAAIAFALGLAACSTVPQPVEQIDAARAALSQAQPVAVSDGAAELRLAQYKLARAEQEIQRGNNTEARIFAEQAEVDAKYAWTLAESARMQRTAAEVNQSVRSLREEADRRSK